MNRKVGLDISRATWRYLQPQLFCDLVIFTIFISSKNIIVTFLKGVANTILQHTDMLSQIFLAAVWEKACLSKEAP